MTRFGTWVFGCAGRTQNPSPPRVGELRIWIRDGDSHVSATLRFVRELAIFYLSERRLGRLSVAEPFTSLNLLHSFSRGESAMHGFRAVPLPSPDFTFRTSSSRPKLLFKGHTHQKVGALQAAWSRNIKSREKCRFLESHLKSNSTFIVLWGGAHFEI